MRDGEFDESEIAVQIEFLEDVGAVRVNRAMAGEKFAALVRNKHPVLIAMA